MEGDLRHLAFTLGPLSFALGAIFSLIIPGNSRKLTLFTGIGLAIVIAAALGRLPVGRSEEHTSELQSLMRISYAVFCLTKKRKICTIINYIVQEKSTHS